MAERDYWDHPGGNACFWNTPIGTSATWSSDGDLDQRDLRAGVPVINTSGNYGCCIWVSRSASDPSATFVGQTGPDYERGANGIGTPQTAVLRVPRGAYTPGGNGPTPADGQMVVFDTTGHPGFVYHFAPLTISNFQGGGTYNSYFGCREDALSNTFCVDAETGNGNFVQASGVIRAYDLDPAKNLARLPAPYSHLPKIQHVLRYSIDGLYLKSGAETGLNSHLKPECWPQYYQDWQGSLAYNNYRGNLLYGSTVGIPLSVTMPSGLSDPGKQLWFALQRYGSVTRDQAGGGYHNSIDQNVPEMWRAAAEADLRNFIRPQLRVMRNQHQRGQSFTTYPMNGPGTRCDEGPPPLRGTTPVTPPVITPSPNGTVVLSGSTRVITDAAGNLWTLPGSQVVINGVVDTATSSVTQLAYVNGVVWHKNTSGLWYGKSSPTGAWSPAGGTTTDPVTGVAPPTESANGTVVLSGASGVITDSTGNSWTLPGTQVVLNGVVDTSTSGVARILYYNDVVWQQNSAGLWWGKTSPTVPWAPGGGTATHPMTSPDKTVVLSGSTGVITDTGGNLWTLPASQVVLNGTADTATSSVTQLAYVSGVVWYQTTAGLWRGKSSPTASWSPSGGTTTNPITGVTPVTESASGTTVLAGASGAITDGAGNRWTLPSTGIVNINGVADDSANVVKIVYVSGVVWAFITLGLWYGKSSPITPWAPSTGTVTPPITVTPSANNTTVLSGASGVITDASGSQWTLPSTQVVNINGVPDTTSAGITKIVWSNGVVWSQHTSGYWWGKPIAWAAWSPPGGAATMPTESSSGTTVLAGASGVITDKVGNAWTLPSTQVVGINGTPDTTSSLVTKIVYDVGVVWALNTLGAWYGKASPFDDWEPKPNGTLINPLTGTPASASGKTVLAGSSGVITDAFSNTWTLPSTQVVGINGTPDTTSAGITKLVYVNGVVWSLHTSGYWFGKDSPAGGWLPSGGTLTPPLPYAPPATGTTVRAGSTGVITDEGGSDWTLPSTQVVNINGVPDTTSSGITKLVYVNGTIWSLHTSGYWWGKASTTAGWLPTLGTTTPPMTFAVPPNGTTVLAGATGIITDTGGSDWTLPSTQVVNINGVPDTTSAGITKIVWVSGILWSQHTSGYWFGKSSPSAAWSPSGGTLTSPI